MFDPHKAHAILKRYFGYDTFRPQQLEITQSIMEGRDTVVLMPTGGGKSICYQIPALLHSGVTLVVSPLLALMKDQVDALLANGIGAAALNSSQSESENRVVWEGVMAGKIKLLYLSPERLLAELSHRLTSLPISLIAIDEAHCISQWGHDFRPEYSKLALLKQQLPHVPIIALTATADKLTREDIAKQLLLNNPRLFVSSFDRPNLSLSVVAGYSKQQKISAIINFIAQHHQQSGIVYCMSRKATEEVALLLEQQGIECGVYHAGLPTAERERAQMEFLNDRTQVICATIAFGMGIDKSNVRWVIHYNLPKSIECYYQEIGRAGRDGLKGDTLLFYTLGDVVMLSKFAEESGQREINLEKLHRMQQYAESPVCRRRILLSYFGEMSESDCGNCDVCKDPPQRFDGTILAQKALSAAVRTQQQVGINLLIDILRGSHRAEIVERGYDKIPTYGVGADLSFIQWQGYLLQMLQLGYFELIYTQGNIVQLTELGWRVVRGNLPCMLTFVARDRVVQKGKTRERATKWTDTRSEGERLFDSLRMLRKQLAEQEGVPAYIIFPDKVLEEFAQHRPTTLAQIAEISGVGVAKLAKYGRTFVNHICKELKQKKGAGTSYEDTLVMLQQGLSVEEIAQYRNLSSVTVYSHIAHLIEVGRYTTWHNLIDLYEIEAVANAWIACNRPKELKPIHEKLDKRMDYGKIRIALAVIQRGEV